MQRLTFWPLQIGGWAFLMVFPLGIWLAGGSSAAPFFWLAFARGATGFALTSALRPLCGRVFAARLHYAILFPGLVVSSLILGFVELEATCWLGRSLGLAAPVAGADMMYVSASLIRSMALFPWLFLYFGIKSLKRFLEVEREFQKAVVRLLRSQMNPHFLFNAPTTIMAVRRDEAKVELVTQSLADYLRFSLQQEQDEQIAVAAHPLGDEIAALENYLRVEKVRFSDDLGLEPRCGGGRAPHARSHGPGATLIGKCDQIWTGDRTSPPAHLDHRKARAGQSRTRSVQLGPLGRARPNALGRGGIEEPEAAAGINLRPRRLAGHPPWSVHSGGVRVTTRSSLPMNPPASDRAIRAVLVDDEPGARMHLTERLAVHPVIEIVGEADRANSAIDLIHRTKPDVVFLDVQMPGGTGFPPPAPARRHVPAARGGLCHSL